MSDNAIAVLAIIISLISMGITTLTIIRSNRTWREINAMNRETFANLDEAARARRRD